MTVTKTLTATMAALLPVGCALLLGCAGTPKKQVPPTPPPVTAPEPTPVAATVPDKPLDVTLRLDGNSATKGAFELQPGDVLKSGDRMAVTVRVDQPAYVYVTVISADGSSRRLFPKEGDQQVTPSEPLRIPRNPDKWISLDNNTGQENVFVYAAKKPLPAEEQLTLLNADVETVKAAAKRSSRPKASKGKDAPSHLTADSRGVILEDEEGSPSSTVDASGVVKKRFIVRHK
ncbi:MAG TPA: DUF4384 domain-containing protein [Pseudomonadota bacterium]|nr:DUF4384 domain-containing protein [Pseudomonadota bacterium]